MLRPSGRLEFHPTLLMVSGRRFGRAGARPCENFLTDKLFD